MENFVKVFYEYDTTPVITYIDEQGEKQRARGKKTTGTAFVRAENRAEAEAIKTDMLNGKSWGNARFLNIV